MKRALLAILILAAGCAPAGRRAAPPEAASPGSVLDTLRGRATSVRSFHQAGTFLVRTGRERHFLHFDAWFERPGRSRLEIDLPGFPGAGSEPLIVTQDGDRVAAVRGGGSGEEATPTDSLLAFLDAYGFSSRTALYSIAPYACPEPLLHERNLRGFHRRAGESAIRLVLAGEGERREVLDLSGPARDLVSRRIVAKDGRVLAVFSYRYEEEGALFAREVETFVPAEDVRLTARFRATERNAPVPPGIFLPADD
jgi:hypothetical protein